MPIIGTVASSRLDSITPTYFLSNNTTISEGWYGIAMDSGRNIFAVGQKDINGFYQNSIMKMNDAGTETTYKTELISQSGTSQNTYFSDLVIDSTDSIIAAGSTGGYSRAIISKYDNTVSSASWRHAIFNGTNSMGYYVVVADSSNNYYGIGIEQTASAIPLRVIVVKYNSSGTVQFAKGITVSGGSDYSVQGAVVNGSDIYIVGGVTIGGNPSQMMIKMTTSGSLTLFKTMLLDNSTFGYDITFANGSLYTVAFIASYYQVVKWDTDFVSQVKPVSISYGSTAGGTVTADSLGNIYVGGWTYPVNRYLGFINKYDADLSNLTFERSFQTSTTGINFETIRANSNLIQDNASNSVIIGSRSWKASATGYGIIRIPQDGSKTQSIAYSVGSMGNLNYTTGLSRLEQTRSMTVSTRTGAIADLTYSVESNYTYTLSTQTITNGRTTFV